jgi:hypothetical protein
MTERKIGPAWPKVEITMEPIRRHHFDIEAEMHAALTAEIAVEDMVKEIQEAMKRKSDQWIAEFYAMTPEQQSAEMSRMLDWISVMEYSCRS